MTLSLEQVRQTRFHLARRNGYEPMDVDNFVDKVEVTLQQLGEENETLKQQLDALTAGGEGDAAAPGDDRSADVLRRQLNESHAEVERLRGTGSRSRHRTGRGAGRVGRGPRVAGRGRSERRAPARCKAELDQAKKDRDQATTDLAERDQRIAPNSRARNWRAHRPISKPPRRCRRAHRQGREHRGDRRPRRGPAVTKLLQPDGHRAGRAAGQRSRRRGATHHRRRHRQGRLMRSSRPRARPTRRSAAPSHGRRDRNPVEGGRRLARRRAARRRPRPCK